MPNYVIEVWADSRPVQVSMYPITASNPGVAARRGYVMAKPSIRKNTKVVTVKTTRI